MIIGDGVRAIRKSRNLSHGIGASGRKGKDRSAEFEHIFAN
jgi:hypothetical protein